MNIKINNNFGIVSTGSSAVNILSSNVKLIQELEVLERNVQDKEEIEKIKLIKQNLEEKDKLKNILKSLKKETIVLIRKLSLKVLEALIMKNI